MDFDHQILNSYYIYIQLDIRINKIIKSLNMSSKDSHIDKMIYSIFSKMNLFDAG